MIKQTLCSVNAEEIILWLSFELRVDVGDDEIQTSNVCLTESKNKEQSFSQLFLAHQLLLSRLMVMKTSFQSSQKFLYLWRASNTVYLAFVSSISCSLK